MMVVGEVLLLAGVALVLGHQAPFGGCALVILASAFVNLATARVLADKLGQKPEAKLLLAEMLSKDRIKDTPEASEAKSLNTRL